MQQSRNNEELGKVSGSILEIIKMLSSALAGLSKKRRDLLRPHIDQKYQKLGKNDEDFNPQFLFGGNLSDRVKEIKARDSLMKEVIKTDKKPQGQPRRQQTNCGQSRPVYTNTQRSGNRQTPYNRPNQGRPAGLYTNAQNGNGNSDFRKSGSSNKTKRS